jgi:hypothetical protein
MGGTIQYTDESLGDLRAFKIYCLAPMNSSPEAKAPKIKADHNCGDRARGDSKQLVELNHGGKGKKDGARRSEKRAWRLLGT